MRELAFTILGLVGASLPPVVVMTTRAAMQDHSNLSHLFGEAGALYIVVLPVVLVLGGIVFWLARSFDFVRFWVALAAGAVIGAFFGLPAAAEGFRSTELLDLATAGALSGLVFWLIWRLGVARTEKVKARAPVA
jgi:hypothetical protein